MDPTLAKSVVCEHEDHVSNIYPIIEVLSLVSLTDIVIQVVGISLQKMNS